MALKLIFLTLSFYQKSTRFKIGVKLNYFSSCNSEQLKPRMHALVKWTWYENIFKDDQAAKHSSFILMFCGLVIFIKNFDPMNENHHFGKSRDLGDSLASLFSQSAQKTAFSPLQIIWQSSRTSWTASFNTPLHFIPFKTQIFHYC